MSLNNSLGRLCMAFAKPYVIAGCYLYPLSVVFSTDPENYVNVRDTILKGCRELCVAMAELLVEAGYDFDSGYRDFALVGTMTCPVETRPLLGEPAAPTATLVVCLPNRERDDQFLEGLIPKCKQYFRAKCSTIVDIKINVSFGGDGSEDFLLSEPFERGASSQELVFVSLEDAEMDMDVAVPRRKAERPQAKPEQKPKKAKAKGKLKKAVPMVQARRAMAKEKG